MPRESTATPTDPTEISRVRQQATLLLFVLLCAQPAAAQIYRHSDSNASVTFSDVPATGGHSEQISVLPANRIAAFRHSPASTPPYMLLPEQELAQPLNPDRYRRQPQQAAQDNLEAN